MSGGEFQTSDWGWQWQQFQQQAGEWVELQFSKIAPVSPPDLPNPTNFSGWETVGGLLKLGGWLLVAIALWQIAKLLERWWKGRDWGTPAPSSRRDAQKHRTVKEWLARSRQQQQQGDYRAACRCLYMAMLQRLSDSGIVAEQPSLTNGEYRQILQQQPHRAAYETLLATHDSLYFGQREATLETVERCQDAYREIEKEA